jgi:predicted permease
MVLDSLFPVFALVVLGHLLKRRGLTHEAFLKTSDRLIYFIFFPAMLFWKIGGHPLGPGFQWRFCGAVLAALIGVYLLSAAAIHLFRVPAFQAGSFSQSCYRFNTYIGMAIVINALGDEGVRLFGILVGLMIPIINLLAVSTLIWYSGRPVTGRERLGHTLRALVSNPLILACLAGMGYASLIGHFPRFVHNTFSLMSMVTLPLALLSIGGALTFDNWKANWRLSTVGSALKLIAFPVLGYGCLTVMAVEGTAFKVGMLFFALPTSTAIFVLSAQLGSDTDLASAAIVLSTVLSFASLSAVLIFF